MPSSEARNARRRERYTLNRKRILEAYRNDRAQCPLCTGVTFRRLYLKRHLALRHHIDASAYYAPACSAKLKSDCSYECYPASACSTDPIAHARSPPSW